MTTFQPMQMHLFTVIVSVHMRVAIPVAWILSLSQTVWSIRTWRTSLKERAEAHTPGWVPNCCITDADLTEITALK